MYCRIDYFLLIEKRITFDTNSLAQKLSRFHLFQISKVRNFREHIQTSRKSLKIVLAKICAFKIMIITHHHGSKNKVYNIYFPYFYLVPCEIFSRKHYFIFRNTAFFKYCMYRQKHADSIIVVNNIPNLQWKIYPGFFADVSSANLKKYKLIP